VKICFLICFAVGLSCPLNWTNIVVHYDPTCINVGSVRCCAGFYAEAAKTNHGWVRACKWIVHFTEKDGRYVWIMQYGSSCMMWNVLPVSLIKLLSRAFGRDISQSFTDYVMNDDEEEPRTGYSSLLYGTEIAEIRHCLLFGFFEMFTRPSPVQLLII
jgi:hypothetical protein